MTHLDDDQLAGVALGEDDPATQQHLRGCAGCAARLSDFRETIVRAGEAVHEELQTPPASVWDAISAELAVTDASEAGTVTDIRRGSAAKRRSGTWWIAGAAAAGVVLGGVGATLLRDTSPTTAIIAQTQLETLDSKKTEGVAEVVRTGSTLDLKLDTRPLPSDSGYLEVWLINTDLQRMVSVGVLDPDQDLQTFPINQSLLDEGYLIVDISREAFDDKPQHSGDSLLRGILPA